MLETTAQSPDRNDALLGRETMVTVVPKNVPPEKDMPSIIGFAGMLAASGVRRDFLLRGAYIAGGVCVGITARNLLVPCGRVCAQLRNLGLCRGVRPNPVPVC